ncbi:MAG: isoprenylcysteine carboxylmethyltransferase family protein [Planctomycetes bacterium]|nr:isoprenylcysteine carboxylmethyltransferase family protein [Planctomycetota bacterium]MCB9919210.1 isoprenylcysteine carboxylmethyltransferase family protein [Planctomycetota bacterium]
MRDGDSRGARVLSLALGVLCHTMFAVGVACMAIGLWTGLRSGRGNLTGASAIAADIVLAVQFPILHSWFLTHRGRRVLTAPFPRAFGRDVVTTLFATFASIQLIAVFALWSPIGPVLFEPRGTAWIVAATLYGSSWLLLAKSMLDAGLGIQTGWTGWSAVARGRSPRYGPLPTRGLFALCRQPIYFAFFAILITAPVWTADRVLLVGVWGSYCLAGPLLKEARFAAIFGNGFAEYRTRVPYFFPRWTIRRKETP